METLITSVIVYFLFLLIATGILAFLRQWKFAIITGVVFVISFILLFIFKPWGYVDNYELGYMFDSRNGNITVLSRTGYHTRAPIFQSIHTIDLRPRQVCITVGATAADSANQRVLNCKLVEFNPKGVDLFLSWHGRGDYSGASFDDLLKIYAYDGTGKTYPFLSISTELKDATGNLIAPAPKAAATPVVEPAK